MTINKLSSRVLLQILIGLCVLILIVLVAPIAKATVFTVSNVTFDPATGSIDFDYSGTSLNGSQTITIYDTTGTTIYWDSARNGSCGASHCKGTLEVTPNSDSGVTSVIIKVGADQSQNLNYPLPLPTSNAPQTPSAVGGWTISGDTWTYASANSFTINGVDRTAIFTKGTRIKMTNNGSTKYGVVGSSTFSTNTTVNLIANSDYSINNSAITAPAYSYEANPQGYPGWFNYNPQAQGFSSVAYYKAMFTVIGSQITVALDFGGTSNSTVLNVQAPIAQVNPNSSTSAYPAMIAHNWAWKVSAMIFGITSNSQFDFVTDGDFSGGTNMNNFANSNYKGAQVTVTYPF